MQAFTSASLAETKKIAANFAKTLKPGDIVALVGDLGAGKTAFASGVADALHCRAIVQSPTFTLLNEYPADVPIYHFDLYRLGSLKDSDWMDEYLFGVGVCLREWAERAEKILPRERITVKLEYGGQDEARIITISKRGETL